jgi:hypothetical protein
VPQGLPEKIQIQLLLADLALQLGDPAPSLRQLCCAFHAMLARQHLSFGSSASMTRKGLLAVAPDNISPAVKLGSLHGKLRR